MATKNATGQNLFETVVENQKKMVDTVTENTKKMTNDSSVNETLDKGSDLYKNWLDSQLQFMNDATEKMKSGSVVNAQDMSGTARNWMENQMQMTRNYMDFSLNTMRTYLNSTLKNMPHVNGAGEKVKQQFDENVKLFNRWNDQLTSQYNELMSKVDKNDTVKSAMKGMNNMSDAFNKFSEMWAPFVKNMQDKNFTSDLFSKGMNPEMFTNFFNSAFNAGNMNWMNNDWSKNFNQMFSSYKNPFENYSTWMNNFNNPAQNWMNNWSNMFSTNTNPFQSQFQNWMNNMQNSGFNMPNFNMQNAYTESMNNWNNMYEQTQNTFAPMFRLMAPNAQRHNAEAMQSLMNKIMQYNIKFGEYQYHTNTTAAKAMQKVAEVMQAKLAKGEDYKGMVNLYSEWLNISDKVFVELFESDEFSKVQAELAALQHQIKKETDLMTEKMIANTPVVTRTEMDNAYQTIHDLKARVRDLEKALAVKTGATKTTKTPVAATKTASKGKSKSKKK